MQDSRDLALLNPSHIEAFGRHSVAVYKVESRLITRVDTID